MADAFLCLYDINNTKKFKYSEESTITVQYWSSTFIFVGELNLSCFRRKAKKADTTQMCVFKCR